MRRKVAIFLLAGLLIAGALFLYIYIDSRRPKKFHVTFLNIGQGDSALIQFANGKKMLVDCGPNKKILSELGRNLPFYDRTIDYVLATHPDLDHYGGCVDVLRRYQVKEIITNGHEKTSDPYWQEWNKVMREEPGAELVTMSSPTIWTIASDTLQFFSPDPALPLETGTDDSNNYSIVFKLTHDKETFLFTGDMEFALENALLAKYCSEKERVCPILESKILKVGHHGSPGSTGEDFLSAVEPRTAVISVGKNHYGHPSLRVIKKLERAGAKVLRTDELGDILLK